MKTQLLALSLIATSGLIAQADQNSMAQTNNENGACSVCCCNPCCCCIPKPKKCIDCECYTPQYYDLQCDWGFFISADFLYWYARETNLSYAVKVLGVNADVNDPDSAVVLTPSSYKHLNTKWDPGFRIDAGWNSECDGWDYYIAWTYIHNKKRNSTSVDPNYVLNPDGINPATNAPSVGEFALINSWINQSFQPLTSTSIPSILTFDRVSARWKTQINWVDFEIGRKYWLSPCFTLRPYTGLRGLWHKTRFRTLSTRTIDVMDVAETATLKDRFSTRMWGVGLLGGLQPNFFFCRNFILYGNFDMALLWGEFKEKKKENYQDLAGILDPSDATPISYINTSMTSRFYQMSPMLDVAIGLRWEEYWCCDRYMTALDLGWEHHVLFNQNHRNKTRDVAQSRGTSGDADFSGFRSYDENIGDLAMGGLVVRLRFDF